MKKWILLIMSLPCLLGFSSLLIRENGLGFMQNQDGTGSPYTNNFCGNCHNSGSFNPSISLTVQDAGMNVVTQYIPGQEYQLSFTINNTVGNPAGYGMQATVLDSEATFIGNFSSPGSNSQITTFSSREYFEQSALNPSNVFTTRWTAPPTLSGNLTFYFTGISSNGNHSPALDNSSPATTFILTPTCGTITGSQNPSVCTGSSFTFNGHTYSAPGSYLDTLSAASGCDSLVTTNLSFTDTVYGVSSAAICAGNTFNFGGTNLNSAGVYSDTLVASVGCDSVLTLTLSVHSLPVVNLLNPDTTICQGDPQVSLFGTPAGGIFSGDSVNGNLFDPFTIAQGDYPIVYSWTDSNSCVNSDTSIFHVAICSGIKDAKGFEFSFGPNPLQTELFINGLKAGMEIEILNLNGSLVKKMIAANTSESISIPAGDGMYLLKLSWENEIWIKRIVVRD